ncbi:MAG: class I SAM-dependent methyltransferase [Gammaproteobacteria bacterium]
MLDALDAGRCPFWDERWGFRLPDQRWQVPETEVEDLLAALRARGTRQVLDLGCGAGRHTRLLASAGFEVYALDLSALTVLRAPGTRQRLRGSVCTRCARA